MVGERIRYSQRRKMSVKIRKMAVFVLVMGLISSGCGSGQLFGPTETPTPPPTPPPTATNIPPTFGEYTGTNPDIQFTLDEWAGFSIPSFMISIPYKDAFDGSGVCSVAWDMKITKRSADGSFQGRISDMGNTTIAVIDGQVIGGNASGNYSISRCISSGGATDLSSSPLTGTWNASLTSAAPQTAVPILAKLGHFVGTSPSVTFDVGNLGVYNFQLDAGNCTFQSEGVWMFIWLPDSGLASFKKSNTGIVSGGGFGTSSAIEGFIKEDLAYGTYLANGCGGNWTAKWVGP
jgi:hypothetical protein